MMSSANEARTSLMVATRESSLNQEAGVSASRRIGYFPALSCTQITKERTRFVTQAKDNTQICTQNARE